jgi:hypothetical protein
MLRIPQLLKMAASPAHIDSWALDPSKLGVALVSLCMATRAASAGANNEAAVSCSRASALASGGGRHSRVVRGRKKDSRVPGTIITRFCRLSQVLLHPDIALRSTARVISE